MEAYRKIQDETLYDVNGNPINGGIPTAKSYLIKVGNADTVSNTISVAEQPPSSDDQNRFKEIFSDVVKDFPTAQVFHYSDYSKNGGSLCGWSYHNNASQATKAYSPSLSSDYSLNGYAKALRCPAVAGAECWSRSTQGVHAIPLNAKYVIWSKIWTHRAFTDLYGSFRCVPFDLDTQFLAPAFATGKRRRLKLAWLNSVGGSSSNWHRKWQYDAYLGDSVPGNTVNANSCLFLDPTGDVTVNGQLYRRKTKADYSNNEITLLQDPLNTGMTASSATARGWLDIPNARDDINYNEQYKPTWVKSTAVFELDYTNSIVKYHSLYSNGLKWDLQPLNSQVELAPSDAGEYLSFYENGANFIDRNINRGVGSKPQSAMYSALDVIGFVYK